MVLALIYLIRHSYANSLFFDSIFRLCFLTSMCMATIDQFLSMTSYKRWNNLQFARRFICFICIFWFVLSIFIFIYYDSNLNSCILTNAVFAQYYTYFNSLILISLLPLTVMSILSVLAFF